MTTYLLLATMIAGSGLSSVLNKKFQLGVRNDLPTMVLYNLINAAFGSIYFYFLCKFNVQMNLVTFVFSAIYAAMVVNGLVLGVVSLSKLSIPFHAIVGMAGSVVGSTVFGVALFNEQITVKALTAAVLMIAAVAVPCIGHPELWNRKNSLPICIWVFANSFIGSAFLKIYTRTPGALDANNMFFMTNFIDLIFAAAFVVLFRIIKGKIAAKETFGGVIGKKEFANIGVRTALSNLNSILSVIVIAAMDISVYTIVTSSLGLIVNACISKLIFREALFKENYISIALALMAIVIRAI